MIVGDNDFESSCRLINGTFDSFPEVLLLVIGCNNDADLRWKHYLKSNSSPSTNRRFIRIKSWTKVVFRITSCGRDRPVALLFRGAHAPSRAHFGASPKCFSCSTKESRWRGANDSTRGRVRSPDPDSQLQKLRDSRGGQASMTNILQKK